MSNVQLLKKQKTLRLKKKGQRNTHIYIYISFTKYVFQVIKVFLHRF